MTIKCVTFDLEGTVVDVESAHHEGHILAANDFGVVLTLEDCFQELPHFIGGPDDAVAKDICKLAAADGCQIDYREVLEAGKGHYNDLLKTMEIKPRDGFLDFFQAIKDIGLKYAIGSVTNQDQAVVLLERSGLVNLVGYAHIVLREDVVNPKPAPDVWIETAKRVNVIPEEQMVFEDSPRGIQGAVSVGAYCVGMPVYNREDTVCDLAKAGAKRIFMHWGEINPTALLTNVNYERSRNV